MNNFTIKEQEAISIWTSSSEEYTNIKAIFKDTYNGPNEGKYRDLSNTLINLFTVHLDTTNNRILYRGDILENETSMNLTDKEIYEYYLSKYKVTSKIVLEESILSFSYSINVGNDSHEYSRKRISKNTPSILYILEKR